MPARIVLRGPNCGAPTPTPVPLRISYTCIEHIDYVETEFEALIDAGHDRLHDAEIHLLIVVQADAVWDAVRARCAQPAAEVRSAEINVLVLGNRYLTPADPVNC